eukprot:1555585-Karenia_brevis.AAC.1
MVVPRHRSHARMSCGLQGGNGGPQAEVSERMVVPRIRECYADLRNGMVVPKQRFRSKWWSPGT